MKYKSTIQKADSFLPILMTQNGYPVYDIMSPTRPGYCNSSGICFYTEDAKVLKDFQNLNTEDKKVFAIKHIEYVKTIKEVLEQSPQMPNNISVAYKNLTNAFEQTVRTGAYGAIHLLEKDRLLVFSYNSFCSATGFVFNKDKKIYEFNEIYQDMKSVISKAYKEGKIEPDSVIEGNSLQILKSKHPDIFKGMSKHQAIVLDILKDFKNILMELSDCKISYDNNEKLSVTIETNHKEYIIDIPKKNKENFTLNMNGSIQEFSKITDVVLEVYTNYSQNKLNKFINKIKV